MAASVQELTEAHMMRAINTFELQCGHEDKVYPPKPEDLLAQCRDQLFEALAASSKQICNRARCRRASLVTLNAPESCTAASADDVAAALVELRERTDELRSFTLPSTAGAGPRAAGSTLISRLRPTVAPAPGAFLAQPERQEEREDAQAARAAWHAKRQQQHGSLHNAAPTADATATNGAGTGGRASPSPAPSDTAAATPTVVVRAGAGRLRRLSVPAYLLTPDPTYLLTSPSSAALSTNLPPPTPDQPAAVSHNTVAHLHPAQHQQLDHKPDPQPTPAMRNSSGAQCADRRLDGAAVHPHPAVQLHGAVHLPPAVHLPHVQPSHESETSWSAGPDGCSARQLAAAELDRSPTSNRSPTAAGPFTSSSSPSAAAPFTSCSGRLACLRTTASSHSSHSSISFIIQEDLSGKESEVERGCSSPYYPCAQSGQQSLHSPQGALHSQSVLHSNSNQSLHSPQGSGRLLGATSLMSLNSLSHCEHGRPSASCSNLPQLSRMIPSGLASPALLRGTGAGAGGGAPASPLQAAARGGACSVDAHMLSLSDECDYNQGSEISAAAAAAAQVAAAAAGAAETAAGSYHNEHSSAGAGAAATGAAPPVPHPPTSDHKHVGHSTHAHGQHGHAAHSRSHAFPDSANQAAAQVAKQRGAQAAARTAGGSSATAARMDMDAYMGTLDAMPGRFAGGARHYPHHPHHQTHGAHGSHGLHGSHGRRSSMDVTASGGAVTDMGGSTSGSNPQPPASDLSSPSSSSHVTRGRRHSSLAADESSYCAPAVVRHSSLIKRYAPLGAASSASCPAVPVQAPVTGSAMGGPDLDAELGDMQSGGTELMAVLFSNPAPLSHHHVVHGSPLAIGCVLTPHSLQSDGSSAGVSTSCSRTGESITAAGAVAGAGAGAAMALMSAGDGWRRMETDGNGRKQIETDGNGRNQVPLAAASTQTAAATAAEAADAIDVPTATAETAHNVLLGMLSQLAVEDEEAEAARARRVALGALGVRAEEARGHPDTAHVWHGPGV